jgi:hypothetical protein
LQEISVNVNRTYAGPREPFQTQLAPLRVEVRMRPLLVTLTLVLVAAPAHAQTVNSRSSFSAIGGSGTTYDDEGSLGKGWLIGGAYDHVLFGTTRVELSAELLTHNRDSGYFQSTGNTAIAGVSLLHRFGKGNAQPYVFGGVTLGHHAGTNTFVTARVHLSTTNPGTRFGFGLALRSGDRIEISPELRMNSFFTSTDSDVWMVPSFGLRIGWRL